MLYKWHKYFSEITFNRYDFYAAVLLGIAISTGSYLVLGIILIPFTLSLISTKE